MRHENRRLFGSLIFGEGVFFLYSFSPFILGQKQMAVFEPNGGVEALHSCRSWVTTCNVWGGSEGHHGLGSEHLGIHYGRLDFSHERMTWGYIKREGGWGG